MTLPTYDKTKRKKSTFEQLPKDAYVVKILGAKIEQWPSGDKYLNIAFDIAEGKYMGFYQYQFEHNTNEDKKWPFDGTFTLDVPADGRPDYVFQNWNTFFADLEDSNNGFVFDGDLKKLKGKLIGGKFHIKQSQSDDGTIWDHTKMRYSCVAEDVRQGKIKHLPKDKLIQNAPAAPAPAAKGLDGFLSIPDGMEEELPF